MSDDEMFPSDSFRQKERIYEYYGVNSSRVKSQIRQSVEGLIESAIVDSQKKLSVKYHEDEVRKTLENMKNSYIDSLREYGRELDEVVDSALKLPSDDMDLEDEDMLDQEIESLERMIPAMASYRNELLKAEEEQKEKIIDAPEFMAQLKFFEGTAQQRHNEIQMIQDISSTILPSRPSKELNNSFGNMSIG